MKKAGAPFGCRPLYFFGSLRGAKGGTFPPSAHNAYGSSQSDAKQNGGWLEGGSDHLEHQKQKPSAELLVQWFVQATERLPEVRAAGQAVVNAWGRRDAELLGTYVETARSETARAQRDVTTMHEVNKVNTSALARYSIWFGVQRLGRVLAEELRDEPQPGWWDDVAWVWMWFARGAAWARTKSVDGQSWNAEVQAAREKEQEPIEQHFAEVWRRLTGEEVQTLSARAGGAS